MRMHITATAIASLTLATATAAVAQGHDPASAQAGAYAIEPSHARVQFSVDHMGTSAWFGDFTRTAGTLKLDPKNVAASQVEVTIQTGSVSTTNAVVDGELKAADWFDAAKFPTLTFRSTKVTQIGADTANIEGDLTFHGVTKPVTLNAKFHGAGVNPLNKAYTVGFDATAKLKRSDFGVSKYVPLVGDEVSLTISAPFVRTGG